MKVNFRREDIASVEEFFLYKKFQKVITFVPDEHISRLIDGLSDAGAGLIGNYSSCSFRMSGTGTFIPNRKARPFRGKASKLSEEPEWRLEMQCKTGDLNNVIDKLLSIHPYEEVAYEVYEFEKRDAISSGKIYSLRKSMSLKKLLPKVSFESFSKNAFGKKAFRKVLVSPVALCNELKNSAMYYGCDLLISASAGREEFQISILR